MLVIFSKCACNLFYPASVRWDNVQSALQSHIQVLLRSPQPVRGLPLCCLLDYICQNVHHDEEAFLFSRIQRVVLLTEAHLFGDAVQVLASLIHHSATQRVLVQPTDIVSSGLEPFLANLPMNHADNVMALQWIVKSVKQLLLTQTGPEDAGPTKRSNTDAKAATITQGISGGVVAILNEWITTAPRSSEFVIRFTICCCRLLGAIVNTTAESPARESHAVQVLTPEIWSMLHTLRKVNAGNIRLKLVLNAHLPTDMMCIFPLDSCWSTWILRKRDT